MARPPPCRPLLAYTDYTSPKFIAAALLSALNHRRRTGQGQHVDCSQAESSIHFLGPAILDYFANGHVQKANGNANPDFAPSGVYPCAGDDRWVALAAPTQAHWVALCSAADPTWNEDLRFCSPETRLANRGALDSEIAVWTLMREPAELEDVLQAVGVPVHRASTSADIFADPQLAARSRFVTLEHPIFGTVPLETSRMRFSRTPAVARWPGPTFGQHSETILGDILGLSDEEITELAVSGALE